MAVISDILQREPSRRPVGSRVRSHGTSRLILWVTLPFLACLFLLAVGASVSERNRAVEDGRRLAADNARTLSEALARILESADLLLLQGRMLERQVLYGDSDSLQAYAGYLSASRDQLAYVDWVKLVDAQGRLVMATASRPGTAADHPVHDRDFFVAHAGAEAGLFIGAAPAAEGSQIVLSRRVNGAEGDFKGVIALGVRPSYIERLLRETRGVERSAVEIVRGDLAVLLRYPAAGPQPGEKPALFRPMIQANPSGSYDAVDPAGRLRLHAFRQAGAYPIYVDVGADRAAVLAAWRMRAIAGLVPVGAIWLACLVIAWYAYRRGQAEDRYRLALGEAMQGLEDKVRERTESLETTVDRLREVVQEKETLFQELNHRVKNNLQLISSLLGLQVTKIKDPDARRAIEISLERVHSISLVHELLYHRDDLAVVDVPVYLDALVARIAAAFFGDGRISCTIDADAVQLPPDTCIRLALIVNEVVTNAAKHAFPDRRRGHITLAFRVGEGHYRLSVADDGVGIEAGDSAKPGHFGLQIVELLARYLNGTCTRDSGSFGTIVTVSFPQAITTAAA